MRTQTIVSLVVEFDRNKRKLPVLTELNNQYGSSINNVYQRTATLISVLGNQVNGGVLESSNTLNDK
ncbi:hypothetical protein [Reichenbachiella versicolor]|uniref:hypothetical protein n=1 Tax=Reichenbachiella versicolor TaxID=1821036 RepID=UPI000D6E729B|nr:hypothetical protein [Reichenbachiella versicolor]